MLRINTEMPKCCDECFAMAHLEECSICQLTYIKNYYFKNEFDCDTSKERDSRCPLIEEQDNSKMKL